MTTIVVVTGERYVVRGSVQEAEEQILAASRGSLMEFARFTEAVSGSTVAINPAHVVALDVSKAPPA